MRGEMVAGCFGLGFLKCLHLGEVIKGPQTQGLIHSFSCSETCICLSSREMSHTNKIKRLNKSEYKFIDL